MHLWLALACGAVQVSLPLGPYVRAGEFVAVRVEGAGAGRHELSGPAILPVRWSGEGGVVLPVLVRNPLGSTLALRLGGDAVDLPVQVLAADERLVVDATGSLSEAQSRQAGAAAFPGQRVIVTRAALTALTASPAAWRTADAVILDPEQQSALLATLQQGGVPCIRLDSPSHPPGPEWSAVEEAEAVWVWRPPPAPGPWLVAPGAYETIIGWRPGRPAGETYGVLLATVVFAAGLILLVALARRPRWRVGIAITLAALFCGGLVLWMALRPDVAIRQADVVVTAESAAVEAWDRWLLLASPAERSATARVAFVGATYPVAYSTGHLEQLNAVLHADAEGRPLAWELTLPAPARQAAVLQRTWDPRTEARFDPWARPLRRLYLRGLRGAAWKVEEERAVVTAGR